MMQPHEAITSHIRTAWSPLCVALLLLVGLAFPSQFDDHMAAVKRGLTRVALGQQTCPYMPMNDARMLLKDWYGITITCTEPTEQMWLAYCQSMYVGNTALDCDYISKYNPKEKQNVMNNMRVCRVTP